MKKNIIILLLIPFLIALLSVITVNATVDIISPDILSIEWDYNDHEGFKKSEYAYKLQAYGKTNSDVTVAEGNQLVFEVKNKDKNDLDPICSISYTGGHYYLKTLRTGEVVITCRNKKGNIFKSMDATIYESGAIIVNPVIRSSQNNIDPNIYYGSVDLSYTSDGIKKVPATFEIKTSVLPSNLSNLLTVESYSSNISSVDLNNGIITLKEDGDGDAFIDFVVRGQEGIDKYSYKFKIVKDGVNVYSYEDLLNCSNKSKDGEKIVLRKSFESKDVALDETGSLRYNNIELFGNYDSKKKSFDFKNEIYEFETTFNDEYIKQWNEFALKNKDYKPISNKVKAGLHIQDDFYGNGYTINMHNLTYPTERVQLSSGVVVPTLGRNDLFRGPLPFYTLGDPNGLPLITAFGQDNCGIYVDGDNITVNDVNVKNCDMENSLSNLEYVGSVMDINGDNNTIKNSRLSNGKNVVRAFSCMNLDIDNCMLQNAMNFLMQVGSNEYIPLNKNDVKDFLNENGESMSESIGKYLDKNGVGDNILTEFLGGSYDSEEAIKQEKDKLLAIQNAMNNKSLVDKTYKCEVNLNNTLFYRSGIASVSLDTLFNGPFLFSSSPSMISDIFGQISLESKPIVPLAAKYVSGISYPSKLNVSGNTKFYDYKDIKKMDITGLIKENISTIAKDFIEGNEDIGGIIDKVPEINIDKIFPIKQMIENKAGSKYTYSVTKDDKTIKYVNIPFAYYGGGSNISFVDTTNMTKNDVLSSKLEVDLLDNYLRLKSSESVMSMMKNLMLKTVTTVTGFEPFNFILMDNSGYLFGETPNINELKDNFKEE